MSVLHRVTLFVEIDRYAKLVKNGNSFQAETRDIASIDVYWGLRLVVLLRQFNSITYLKGTAMLG